MRLGPTEHPDWPHWLSLRQRSQQISVSRAPFHKIALVSLLLDVPPGELFISRSTTSDGRALISRSSPTPPSSLSYQLDAKLALPRPAAGYSSADGHSEATTDGASTTTSIQLPLTPENNKCGRITLVTRMMSAAGATREPHSCQSINVISGGTISGIMLDVCRLATRQQHICFASTWRWPNA